MRHIFDLILANLETIIENGGYAIIFLITFLEGIPVIGSLIPGHTIVILSGFFAKLNILNIYIVSITIIISAMLGDFLGYYLGKRYGINFLKNFGKFLNIKDEYIEKTKSLIGNHTGKAIIFGRFNPITRPLIPFIVGASNIHIKKFWIFDFIGVSLWSLSSIAIGYIFGASYHAVAGIFGKFILIAILLSILIIWSYHFINKNFHIFAKYELIVLTLNLLGLYTFFITIQDSLSSNSFLTELDIWINTFFLRYATYDGLYYLNIISNIIIPIIFSFIILIGIIYLIKKKQWIYASISFLSIYGGLLFGIIIKEIIERSRPINSFVLESGYSFPSNHTLIATVISVLFIYFFIKKIKSWIFREMIIVFFILLIIFTAFTRLYIGVHWFSDTIAGFAFGLFWATFIILLIRYISMIVNSIKEKYSI